MLLPYALQVPLEIIAIGTRLQSCRCQVDEVFLERDYINENQEPCLTPKTFDCMVQVWFANSYLAIVPRTQLELLA